MMKIVYETPDFDVIEFEIDDVITASTIDPFPDDNDVPWFF